MHFFLQLFRPKLRFSSQEPQGPKPVPRTDVQWERRSFRAPTLEPIRIRSKDGSFREDFRVKDRLRS